MRLRVRVGFRDGLGRYGRQLSRLRCGLDCLQPIRHILVENRRFARLGGFDRLSEPIGGLRIGDLGLGFDDIVRTTIFLADIGDFGIVNEAYGGYFGDAPPARSTVQVGALPGGFLVEIDAIAAR